MNLRALRIPLRPAKPASPRSCLMVATLAVVCASLTAQQPYPSYPSPNGQYPSQPYGYSQPQYAQPQYPAQQQYAQPQYQAPQQYAQPQYPQAQPYAAQPNAPQQYAMEQPPAPQQTQPALSPDQLEQLVAPIALYPDQLLAQILTASTYPAQVAVADQWLKQIQAQGAVSPDQIADGADSQTNWDPSVKALTAFPQVLDMMDHNLQWTTNLGDAYYNQPQDVMQIVQVMRQRAEDAGNLQSTPQEQVTYQQGAIELAPANPQMVYVPAYNPWDVYGQPVSPYPGFSLIGALGSFFGGAPIHYGLGIAMAAFDHTPFGLIAWGLDWLAHSVLFQHNAYFTHSTTVADWGFPRGGARAYGGWARDPHFSDPRFSDPRFSSVGRSVQAYNRPGYGGQPISRPTPQFARPAPSFAQPAQQYGRPGDAFNRSGYPAQSYGAARPAMPTQQAYSRVQPQISRPQAYAGSGAYGYAGRPAQTFGGQTFAGQTFAARPGTGYAIPSQSFRAPQASAPREFAQAPSRGYGGFSSDRSSSFHTEKAPKSFGGNEGKFKAPKAPKESHSSGGGGGKHHR